MAVRQNTRDFSAAHPDISVLTITDASPPNSLRTVRKSEEVDLWHEGFAKLLLQIVGTYMSTAGEIGLPLEYSG